MPIYINSKEIDALLQARDFVSSNSNGANDQEYYQSLMQHLDSIFKKANRDWHKQKRKRIKNR